MNRRTTRRCLQALALMELQIGDLERRITVLHQRLNESAPADGQVDEGNAVPFILPGQEEGTTSVTRD